MQDKGRTGVPSALRCLIWITKRVRSALDGVIRNSLALTAACHVRRVLCCVQGVLPCVVPEQLQQLLAATAPFQSAYLAGCLSRMSEAVMAAFPGGSRQLPAPADVQKCIA